MPEKSDIELLHDEVDVVAGRLEKLHRERLACKPGCSACCVDDITVWEAEADLIRKRHAALLRDGAPHAAGACAFLDDEGACRIYDSRPYVCRTQGLPIRWIDHDAGVEHRDICELNEEGPPIVELSAEACHTIGPFEAKLYTISQKRDALTRVRLRDLFQASRKP